MAQPSVAEVLALARALSPGDRLGLVSELIDELEGPEDEAWASAWKAELDRRMQDSTERTGATWEEVRARALQGLSDR